MNKEEQDRLVKACKKNNRDAMEKMYNVYMPRMLSVSFRYCKNQSDAEDIVQDAFIKVFKNIKKYKHNGTLGSWIERIVVNSAIDHWHKMKKTVLIDNSEFIEESDVQELDEIEKDQFSKQLSAEKLRTLISDLPEQYRYVLNLYAIEGYSHKEIGKILKIKESTSRSNYTRARKKLLENMRAIGIEKH
ncbi:RNA polymerase sigma factor [Aquimarina sp. BL5]|uniref:RNA polymerase sigma factor n=1 Tax=Aquimarina sp. BL5 TaxID=1714860 RepID=UPI000E551F07|nr:RNA polymerase sigma factor [Aquimarina sp. BL5]AXT50990.1 RNA polymerase sigma factor [Aquimarina sp. BL5]RKN02556.1 sigma-70 family RNA polymerase sigma factor [Aquimarina sp. BL5]